VSSARTAQFVAVVTGAGSGIGTVVAAALARHGCDVAVVGRRSDRIEKVSAEICAAGGKAAAFACDVRDPAAVQSLYRDVSSKFGKTSILVNGAGVFEEIVSIRESDPAKWIDTIQVNTIGPYLTSRAFMGDMISQKWGRIINISSAASVVGPVGVSSAYQLSKVALNWFTRQLAAELEGTGVTANAMHPGEVKTEMWASLKEQAAARGKAGVGMLKWAKLVEDTGGDPPEKTAELILKLIDPASDSVTGQFLWIANGLKRPVQTW
jgi:NAD(P)-dependent dehydrogenase (short-subunit alcohol dehydrogenase family)